MPNVIANAGRQTGIYYKHMLVCRFDYITTLNTTRLYMQTYKPIDLN